MEMPAQNHTGIGLFAFSVFVLGVTACGDNLTAACRNRADTVLQPLEQHGFVAHAGGSPDGLQQGAPYTNSREAFETSYRNGFRVYEFDLITLGDGTVVLAHDFHEEHYGLDRSFREISRDDLEGRRYDDRYELLFAEDLIELMVSHRDIWIILDTKWDHEFIAQRLIDLSPGESVSDRFVPHLASDEHTELLRAIYPFPERMIAMYRWAGDDTALLDRMERYDIDNVMMWWDIRWTPETQTSLDGRGHHVWVHTPQEPGRIESFRAQGVRVYTDGYISPCGP